MATQVTVSIVSHGHGPMVADLLDDLSRQTLAGVMDVVLTLNFAEPDFDFAASCVPSLTVRVNERPKGFAANHNAALADARGEWVVVINPDVRLNDETLIERLIGGRQGREVGLVVPMIYNSGGGREDSIRHNLDPLSLLARRIRPRNRLIDPSGDDGRFRWVAGMFMALPAEVWRAVGGFDERFFLYCEDYDLCARLVTSGRTIVIDPALKAVHDARRSSHTSFKYLRWHFASLLRVWTSSQFWKICALDLRASPRGAERT